MIQPWGEDIMKRVATLFALQLHKKMAESKFYVVIAVYFNYFGRNLDLTTGGT